tara:strand:+ start:4360 stop:4551 length:192 start_codon:yes stop_codon:yes gene_type:complete
MHQKLKGMAVEKKTTCAALVEQMLLAYFRWNNIDFKFKPKKKLNTKQAIKEAEEGKFKKQLLN